MGNISIIPLETAKILIIVFGSLISLSENTLGKYLINFYFSSTFKANKKIFNRRHSLDIKTLTHYFTNLLLKHYYLWISKLLTNIIQSIQKFRSEN